MNLNWKQSFWDKKIEVLKSAKKWTFFKEVSPWILSKNWNLSFPCFSQKLCPKRSFLDILNRKQSFLNQKIEVLTRAKKWTFLKGLVHGLCPKIELFLISLFHRNHVRKDRLWYCRKKRMIWSRKNRSFKKDKKRTFLKGVSPWILSKNGTFSYRRFSQKSYQKTSFLILWKERIILSGKNWGFK